MLQKLITQLMSNDHNAVWFEVQSLSELQESLIEALTGYEPQEETAIFYQNILSQIQI